MANSTDRVPWRPSKRSPILGTRGEDDEIGLAIVKDRFSVPDWHEMILHILGMRPDGLFLDQNGLNEKLTRVNPARIAKKIRVMSSRW